MNHSAADAFLADALRSPPARWPPEWAGPGDFDIMVDRILYHGVAGLLVDGGAIGDSWPEALRHRVRQQAISQAMWENRHRVMLAELLESLASRRLDAVLLKGTAVAYSLYANPAARQRGDSDLLVRPDQLDEVRLVLSDLGYRRFDGGQSLPDHLQLQEIWSIETMGQSQAIDLHWSALNSLALRRVLGFDEIHENAVPLPRLSGSARAADPAILLFHACLHRLMHDASPYIVDGVDYYGGNRLIWLYDIHLLVAALDESQWTAFTSLARRTGTSSVCRDGLVSARSRLGATVPEQVLAQLGDGAGPSRAARYLQSGQFRRAVMDVLSVKGLFGKLRLVTGRMFPGKHFLHAKYPGMEEKPIVFLHMRRLAELVRERPRG